MTHSFASVVLNLPLDKPFDYRIPARLSSRISIGTRVLVPFGSQNEPRSGFVVALKAQSEREQVKELLEIETEREQIPAKLLDLARWMASYYCAPYDRSVIALLPGAVRRGEIRHRLRLFVSLVPGIDAQAEAAKRQARAPKQALALLNVQRLGTCEANRLCSQLGIATETLKRLEEDGLVVLEKGVSDRLPANTVLRDQPLDLTEEQKTVMTRLLRALETREVRTFLLHGVTGSGKTEIYLQAIARCLELGREAIVLVPEISLTPQTVERFQARFGALVSVLHSGLGDGERFDEWTKINEGRTPIVVGARSALFAPMRKLGLVIVDEEHDSSYKQGESPRYHARDVAVYRGRLEQAVVLLGSATPSMESYHNSSSGKYERLELLRRVDEQAMPEVEIVDMRNEPDKGIFSRRLKELVGSTLANGDQAILFLNRRGYATQFLCQECGHIAQCPSCNLTYTYHRKSSQLCCHCCGHVIPAPVACPKCGSDKTKYSGVGTEKVENVTRALFPSATTLRMDADTTSGKNAHQDILDAFKRGEGQILIGTQMIAKGLHFPGVTLVGVINADTSLHLPDFRSGERTFCLLTQVAGRAGRGGRPGRVVVQSYTAYHPVLQYAAQHDYQGFYREEIEMRRALSFPPASHLIIVHFRGDDQERVSQAAQAFAASVSPLLPPGVIAGEPTPAPVDKIKDQYRWQVYFRGGDTLKLIQLLRKIVFGAKRQAGLSCYIDVDPVDTL